MTAQADLKPVDAEPRAELILPDGEAVAGMAHAVQNWVTGTLLTVDTAIQCAVILSAFIAGAMLARTLKPTLTEQIEKMRLPLMLRGVLYRLRRLTGPIFTLLILFGAALLQTSLSGLSIQFDFVTAIIRLVAAWIIIRLAVSVIQNKFLQNVIAATVWTVAALSIFGILGDVRAVLDGLGITVGDFRLTALTVVKCIIATLVMLHIAYGLAGIVEQRLGRLPAMTSGSRLLITKIVRLVLVALAVLTGATMAGVNLSVLAVFSGAIGLGIGLGLQRGVSNLFTGMMLLMDRTIQPGDTIDLPTGGYGVVGQMGSRCTEVRAGDGKTYLIPNEDLVTKPVVNWSRQGSRIAVNVPFTVDYRHNPHDIIKLAADTAAAVPRVLKTPAPGCALQAFGENGLNFILGFWIDDPHNGTGNVQGDVLLALWDAFDKNGIKIPRPRHDIYMLDGNRGKEEG